MENSPKIYFLKNSEGKYYNSRDKLFYTSITNANYDRDLPKMKLALGLPKLQDCEIVEINEYQFMEEMATETANVALVGEYFSSLLFKLAYRLPTVSQVNKTMYQKCKSAVEVLKPFTVMHQEFLKTQEDQTDEVQGYYTEFIAEACKVGIHQTHEVTAILRAYQKDRASMLGITKKVLK